eukprot:2256258-Rhodomonas_salina.1
MRALGALRVISIALVLSAAHSQIAFCPAGQFISSTGGPYSNETECLSCPSNSFSPNASSSSSDCTCIAGYEGPDANSCMMCSAGTYKDGMGMGPCTICPVFSNSSAGSSQMTDCSCIPGYIGVDGSTCAACPEGSFKTSSGPGPCSTCPPLTTSSAGSSQATDCSCIAGYEGPDVMESTPRAVHA